MDSRHVFVKISDRTMILTQKDIGYLRNKYDQYHDDSRARIAKLDRDMLIAGIMAAEFGEDLKEYIEAVKIWKECEEFVTS